MIVRVLVNGQEREVPHPCTVAQLLACLNAPERGIAVAVNERVLPRGSFGREPVAEGDRIEIIKAVAGG